MRNTSKFFVLFLVVIFMMSFFSLMGCTKHPNAEQLQALEEQKNAALSAENTLEERRREKSKAESEINQKRKELQDAKNELEEVKKRLAQ